MPGEASLYDVIVVGSGASGGWACKRLAEAGLKVAVLEAGAPQPDKDFTEHVPAFQLEYRNRAPELIRKERPIQSRQGCDEYTYKWFASDIDEPYTTPPDRPYFWTARLRRTGGRTNSWGRVSLRFSDLDFKAASRDGHGEDWPLSYSDLKPYYELVEDYVGVLGLTEGLPQLPDSKFQPHMALNCQEVLFRNRVKEKLGWTATPTRAANLTQPRNGRASCHYCGPCHRGCMTHSYFNSSFTTVADALSSGNCTLISNAMVYQVKMDQDGKLARSVTYIDRNTSEMHEIRGRAVILCAQSFESTRILLNSADGSYPSGLGNSSGVLGHYLMAHFRNAGGSGELPDFGEKPSLGGPKRPVEGIYIARFRNIENVPPSKNFLRGYGYEGGGFLRNNMAAPGYGEAFKKAVLDPQAGVNFTGFGEVLGRWDNFVQIDPKVKDRWGIPVLHISMADGPNEDAMSKDVAESIGEMLEAAGAKNIRTFSRPSNGHWAVHEAGIARMGNNPKTSILNQFQQSHDIRNLFVMDAASFATNPCQNPTLTIMALCVRSCDYLMGEMKRGNV